MSNKETLQEYNTKLIANNDSLQTVMDMINNLPEAGGSADILLQDKSIEITENGTTNIVADEGYDGLNNVEVVTNVSGGGLTEPLYLIENGYEITDVTGGSELVHDDMGSGITNGVYMSQGEGSLNFYGGLWQAGNFVFNNEIDLSKHTYLCIDYAFPSTTNSKWSAEIKFQMIFKNTNKTIIFHNGGTTTRITVKIPITDFSEKDIITFYYQNLGATNGVDNGSAYDPNSPLLLYNMWLEDELSLQNKSVEITENGTQTITADEGYVGLNSVTVNTNVRGNNILDNTDFSLGGWGINNTELIQQAADDIYRFNKIMSVVGGETLYLSKSLVLHFNVADTSVNYNTTGDLIITVPTGATEMAVRCFAADAPTFNPSEYIISRSPIVEDDGEVFSKDEVKTNKTWIDGKPIYRKVFTGTLPTAASYSTYVSLYFDISDTNYDTPVDIYGSIDQSDGFAFWSLNWYNHVAGASAITNINNDTSNKIQVRHNCNWLSDQPVFVVFEYTKTTD